MRLQLCLGFMLMAVIFASDIKVVRVLASEMSSTISSLFLSFAGDTVLTFPLKRV